MRQLLASIFTLLLTAAIALALDPQTKAEIDELITSSRRPVFASFEMAWSIPEPRARSICATNSPRPMTA